MARQGFEALNCSALTPHPLEPGEAARLTGPLGINPDTLSPARMEAAWRAAGLRVVEHGTTTDEGSPFLEPLDEGSARDVLRLAKMLRSRARTTARLGAGGFEILTAYYQWNVYLLMGRTTYGVWVLECGARQGLR